MSNPNPDEAPLKARPATVLSCEAAHELSPRKRSCVLLTLGHIDGSIDPLELTIDDAAKLLGLLIMALRLPKSPLDRKKWAVPHSVGRAELEIGNDLHSALYQLRQRMPDVADYVEAQMKSFKRAVAQRGKNTARPENIARRFLHAMLVAVEAARD
jgi:hypothetical protein